MLHKPSHDGFPSVTDDLAWCMKITETFNNSKIMV